MAKAPPGVGIVILNWRQPQHTADCLNSLTRLDYPSYEVVVVDNGSGDGSAEAIRRRFPAVTVIENGRNLGFAAGCNVGLAHLLRRGVDYALLLNDDTEVGPGSLAHLVETAESAATIGIVGPTICYFDQPETIWSAGGGIEPDGESRHLRVNQFDSTDDETARDVDYVTGCALLAKRSVMDSIGLLDERFFAYYEEAEWCARARKAGFRVVYVPQARVWHKIKEGERPRSWNYIYLMTRNRLLYLSCTGARRSTMFLATVDLLRTAGSWSVKPRHGEMRPYSSAIVRGIGDFMAGRFGPPPRPRMT